MMESPDRSAADCRIYVGIRWSRGEVEDKMSRVSDLKIENDDAAMSLPR